MPTAGTVLPSNIALVAGDLDDYGAWHDDPAVRPGLVPACDGRRLAALPARPLGLGRAVRLDLGFRRGLGLGAVPLRHLGLRASTAGPGFPARPTSTGARPWSTSPNTTAASPGVRSRPPRSATRRPSLGFRSGNWSLVFSIGGAPSTTRQRPLLRGAAVQQRRRQQTVYVNNVRYQCVQHQPHDDQPQRLRDQLPFRAAQRPDGGRDHGLGEAFGGRGEYQPAPRVATAFFAQGRGIGAPQRGRPRSPVRLSPAHRRGVHPTRTFLPATGPDPGLRAAPDVPRAAAPARGPGRPAARASVPPDICER